MQPAAVTRRLVPAVAVALLALAGWSCAGEGPTSAPTTTAPTTTTTSPPTTTTTPGLTGPDARLATWLLNTDGRTAAVIEDDGPIPVNVQSVELATVDGIDYVHVLATGIPDYTHLLTEEGAAFLAGRPRAGTDFREGLPLVGTGDTLDFGQDLGYASSGCRDLPGSGYGFWPPGPACPTRQDWDAWFPVELVEADEPTATGLGVIGLWVNGVAVFNWGDGQSWADERVWFNLAPVAEVYDLDVCPGHSAMGAYHHHSHPVCLADELGDDGSSHSPVYGYGADGVPIAGPWVADNVLARSSWRVRDYVPTSQTGCVPAGDRSCLMADPLEPLAGTVPTDNPGPGTSDTVRTMSGNEITAVAGLYAQDWYFDSSLDDGSPEALDEHNGHLGGIPGFTEPTYHYHVTRTVDPGVPGGFADVFPYYVGPTFWGALHDNALVGVGPGGPGGPGPGAGPGAGGPPDFTRAAEALGVTVDELLAALGPPPPDLDAAAATLGITVEALRSALPPPPRPGP